MIKQPICTWSNLAFVIVGLLIMVQTGMQPGPASPRSPMAAATLYSIGYGALVIFLGPGSMFFHASIKKWGGWIDNLSMNLFVSFVLLYDLSRMLGVGEVVFVIVFLALNVTLGVVVWTVKGSGKWIFGCVAGLVVLAEVLILVTQVGGVQRDFAPWLLLALLSFGAGFVVWALSNTGGPLCKRDSWFQGHAVWHVLTALTTGFLFLYLLSEV